MTVNAGRVGTAKVVAVKAPTTSQLEAAALRKVRHPEAPHEAAALEEELRAQRGELTEMSRLLEEDPEGFDRYFDQVAETGEVKQGDTTIVTVEQVPAKKPTRKRAVTAKKQAAKKATTRKQVAEIEVPVRAQIEATPPAIVPVIPVPPPLPGSQTIKQEE
jgi:hypothetical protein